MNKHLIDIKKLAKQIKQSVRLMEVCGTHTEAIAKAGIRQLMPKNIELVTGPGCPVCVTDQRDIDAIVELALRDVPIACYGDVLRVPGTKMSLEQARAEGASVHVVYSTEDALALKKDYPELVFFGIGFETTAPMTASAIKRGLAVYSVHKYFPPAMLALAKDPQIQIDGFINPGHVSAIIGAKPYRAIKKPQVIAGFTPSDVLQAIEMLLKQINLRQSLVENQYTRLVHPTGNHKAQRLLDQVFEPATATWRGLGAIPKSGMKIKPKFSDYNAEKKYAKIIAALPKPTKTARGCQCAAVIKGQIKPAQCKLFAKQCEPEKPIGACMVSREGACRIAYEHR
ncbi:hydrogenase formation protein HypD [Patescibacteria group bacterium]